MACLSAPLSDGRWYTEPACYHFLKIPLVGRYPDYCSGITLSRTTTAREPVLACLLSTPQGKNVVSSHHAGIARLLFRPLEWATFFIAPYGQSFNW
jgi:hypothetical protein